MLNTPHLSGQIPKLIFCLSSGTFRRYSSPKAEKAARLTGSRHDERYKKGRTFDSASEIANLINLNPHVSVGDAIERLWERNNKRVFNLALARNKLQSFTQEERLKELGLLELANAVIGTEDQKEYQKMLNDALVQTSSRQDRNVVKDFINTSRGIKHEKVTFENLKKRDTRAKLAVDTNLYQRTINIPDSNVQYLISGYIDGVEINNQRIIEIKTRQHRLFNHVPLYEQVQCQAYLYLTGLAVCEHTESFRAAMRSTTLSYEPVFWGRVLERLNRVILAFDAMIKDISAQDAFLQSRDLFASTVAGNGTKGATAAPRRSIKSSIYEIKDESYTKSERIE